MATDPTPDLVGYHPVLTQDFYTLGELGPMLGVSPASLRQRLNRHRMVGRKVGTTWTVDRTTAWAALLEANRDNVARHCRREKGGLTYNYDMGHAACAACQRQRQEDTP